MSGKAFQSKDKTARMKRPEQRWSAGPGLDIATCNGGRTMPENTGRIPQSDSASNPQHGDNWQHVSESVSRLKERVVAAMNAGNYEVAESYHAKLINAEAEERGQS